MQAVGQGEIDNSIFATEGYRWLGTIRGQWLEARTYAPSENDCKCITGHDEVSDIDLS